VAVAGRSIGEVVVLRCDGDLDLSAVDAVAAAARETLAGLPAGLVLDLSGVTFCDTVGLRTLLSTAARARAQGCPIALAGVRTNVAEFLGRVCADRTLPAYDDVTAAVDALYVSRAWR
jgi:anti-sigma B factor antagonist